AISHWFWPRTALRRNAASFPITATGLMIHTASSLFWAGAYRALRELREGPTPANAMLDAALVSALAALVDLKIVPERLTPGFQHRLRPAGVVSIYVAFGIGLAAAGAMARSVPRA